jgi:Tripartite tricarboxylate transporter family receptor
LTAEHHLTIRVDAMNLKNRLRDIETDSRNRLHDLGGRLRRKRRRSPGLPEVPTFQKAGIKGLAIKPWFGVFVPAGTPAAIVVRLNYPLSYANFNGMQIRRNEPAWMAQSGGRPRGYRCPNR